MDGRADVGVVVGSVDIPQDLTVYSYREDRLMVLMPRRHALSKKPSVIFEEVLEFEHVGIGVTSAISVQLAEEAGRLHRHIHYAYRVATYDVARWMVAKGCGIAVLPSSLVIPYASMIGIDCIPLSDRWAQREMRIYCRHESTLTIASRMLIGHLRNIESDEIMLQS